MKTSEVLEKALELLGPNGEGWIKGTYGFGSPHHCPAGAIWDRGAEYAVACCKAEEVLEKAIGGNLVRWNDDTSRTFPEVATKFREAIQLAKSAE